MGVIATNVAVYLAMVGRGVNPIDPDAAALLPWGAEVASHVTAGESWRLLTLMFLHFGIIHLAMNLFVLWNVGPLAERLLGRVPFITLYVLTGLAGGVANLFVHPAAVSAGASGAIRRVRGIDRVRGGLARRAIPEELVSGVLGSQAKFIIINLIYGFSQQNISVAAHVGGFVAGIPLGWLLTAPVNRPIVTARYVRSAAAAVGTVALVALVLIQMGTIDDLQAEVTRMFAAEGRTVDAFNAALAKVKDETMTADEFARTITEQGPTPWGEERARLEQLRLPSDERTKQQKFVRYMSLRGEAWRLRVDAIQGKPGSAKAANDKDGAALSAIADLIPGTSIADRLAVLRTDNARIDHDAAEAQNNREAAELFARMLRRVGDTEKIDVTTINSALTKVRARTMTGAELDALIEKNILPSWNRLRADMRDTPPPAGQTSMARTIDRYMLLRAEAWQLMGRGAAQNNLQLMQAANAKDREASTLAKSLAPARVVPGTLAARQAGP